MHTRVSALSWSEVFDVVTQTRCHSYHNYTFSVVLCACYCAVHLLPLCSSTNQSQLITAVMSCDWLVEGQQLVTASLDHTAKLWDFESGQIIHSLEGESTTSWFPVPHYQSGGIVSPFVYSILSSLPFNSSLPSYLCSPLFSYLHHSNPSLTTLPLSFQAMT